MTKEQFRKYRDAYRNREYLERQLRTLEQRAAKVPTVKDKVTASEKDWPYIETHITVDAPDPQTNHKILREIRRCKRLYEKAEHDLDELTSILVTVEDNRARQILTLRYIEGKKLKDVAIQYDMTEQGVLKIISNAIKKLSAV